MGIKQVQDRHRAVWSAMPIEYAILNNKRKSVTIVHKGNIMKYTEGAFRNWSYAVAEREFGSKVYTWDQWERTKADKGEKAANEEQKAALAKGAVLIKDAIADITLQQVLTRPEDFDVIATLNLNGDYLSDALAAQVGGIGIAPGGNINYVTGHAIFEATHGTAPKYADQDKVNPGSLMLSGEMMLRYMGWTEAADLINKGLSGAITSKRVTYDFARQMDGATEVKFRVRDVPADPPTCKAPCRTRVPIRGSAGRTGSTDPSAACRDHAADGCRCHRPGFQRRQLPNGAGAGTRRTPPAARPAALPVAQPVARLSRTCRALRGDPARAAPA